MNFLLHIIAIIAIGLPQVLGYNVIFGKGKIFHFGPIGVSLMAAYATFLTITNGGSYLLGITLGAGCALLISLLFAWLSFRLEADALGILSIAVHLTFLTVVLNSTQVTRGALGIPRIPRLPFLSSLSSFATIATVIAILWLAILYMIDKGPFGRKLQALAEHEWHAKSLGVDREHTHIAAFLLGGIGAAISSILMPQYLLLLHPNDYTFPFLIILVMIVVAGKPGSILGVTLSAILLTLLKEGLRFLPLPTTMIGPIRLLLFGVILLLAVYVRRDSLFPQQRKI